MDWSKKHNTLLLPTLAITVVILGIKFALFPFYWPGGDYQNHLQNAYYILASIFGSKSSFAQYAANAWWQPIGGGIYLLLTGVTFLQTWYGYFFGQAFMAALCLVVIYDFSRSLPKAIGAVCAISIAGGLFVFFDYPHHNLNFGLQALACWLAVKMLANDAEWTTRRSIYFALLLVALNLVRSSGFILLAGFVAAVFIRGLVLRFPLGWGRCLLFIVLPYCFLNLVVGILFAPRLAESDVANAGDQQCYLDYVDRAIAGKYEPPPDIDKTALLAKYNRPPPTYPFAAFRPEDDLRSLIRTVPNYSTFRLARLAGETCKDTPRWMPRLARLVTYAAFGDVTPRAGRQLLITLQDAASRSSEEGNFPISELLGEKIDSELRASLDKLTAAPFFREMDFLYDYYNQFYKWSVDPYLESLSKADPSKRMWGDKPLTREELEATKSITMLGVRTAWDYNHSLTVLEGFVYIMFGTVAGPIVTDKLYIDMSKRILAECPSCRWIFVENVICQMRNLFVPYQWIKGCRFKYSNMWGWWDAGPKMNDRHGMPARLGSGISLDPIPNKSLEYRSLHTVYFLSIYLVGVLSCITFLLFVIPRTSKALFKDSGVQFLGFVILVKMAFLGLFAASGDITRYSDELRLFVLMLFPLALTIALHALSGLPKPRDTNQPVL